MQGKKTYQNIPIRYVRGVGPKKSELFNKLGIESIFDLFYYLPRRYEDRSNIVEIKDLQPGMLQGVSGTVLKTNVFRAKTGTTIFEMAIGDEKSRVFAVWYNMPFIGKAFTVGQKVVLFGKVELQKRIQLTHPAYEVLSAGNISESLAVGRIVPVYSLTASLSQRYLRKVVHQALKEHLSGFEDPIPTKIRAKRKLVDSKFAVENIHFPYSFDNLEKAYKRLVFEEFFFLQLVMAMRRKHTRKNGIKHSVSEVLVTEFENLFTFNFTEGQKKCISEIEKDMSGEKPMYRLLQGDVGSGKTVAAMYALFLCIKNGYQAAMMVPTEILARQHFVTVSKAFMPLGLNVRLLVNGLDNDSKTRIKNEIAQGEADIVIGTHSLIQEGVNFSNLGLAVIDEQHKFGVTQRKSLTRKGAIPDTLVLTATPIPRSLALTVYGDMDLSLLKEKPAERVPVTTYWVGEEKREAVYEFIRGELKEKRQAFIVYPRVKDSGKSDLRSAEAMYEHLKKDVFAEYKTALIHGRLKSDQKEQVMSDFKKGKYDILIATTVIEVGVDIPNVTVMVVEHAERYGLAQLHQLRGRIGRGKKASYCILLGEPKTDASYEKLSTMAETDDGFKIAEKDLDIRGPGEFLGSRQSGLPEVRFGNILRDFEIMEMAREEAFNMVREDPFMNDPENMKIKNIIRDRFGKKRDEKSVA